MAANQAPIRPKTFDELIEAAAADAATIAAVGGSSVGAGLVDLGPGAAGFAWHASLPVDLEIVREIHRGGQGVVYQAIHTATSQIVAVKVLSGLRVQHHSDRIRFERETEILRGFRHPGIVTIIDSGIVGDCHYIVMDFVEGERLDEYVAAKKPALAQTLGLFAAVCEAVNAAHLRGVIHRDLKPGNILVDRAGCPRVLDFGLAKVVSDGDGEQSLTAPGQFVGSLPWASPEQAEGRQGDIDTRSDVYSLGVILYQLLTGQFPYAVHGTMRETLDQIAGAAPVLPRSIQRDIDDETETIVLKCLAKERERRYETAGDLARDLRRRLAGEAIEAKRDSRSYMLRKFVRRNRMAALALSAVTLALAAGFATSLVFWRQALAEARAAERARGETVEALALVQDREFQAIKAREAAELRERETDQVASFMASILEEIDLFGMAQGIRDELYKQASAGLARQSVGEWPNRRGLTAEEIAAELSAIDARIDAPGAVGVARRVLDQYVLQRASDALDTQFQDQPLVRARIQNALGLAYQSLGQLNAAESQFRAALEQRRRHSPRGSRDLATSLCHLGILLDKRGDHAAALPLLFEALEIDESEPDAEAANIATAKSSIGVAYYSQGRYAEAEPYVRDALAMRRKLFGDIHPEVAESLNNLSALLFAKGDYEGAEPAAREALTIKRELHGHEHAEIAQGMNTLAEVLRLRGDYAGAEPLYRESLASCRRLLGNDHPQTAVSLVNLGELLRARGQFEEAEPLLREALAARRKLLGDEHTDVALALNNLGMLRKSRGDYAEAERCYREALDIYRKCLGEEHPHVALVMNNVGGLLFARRELAEAEELYRTALAIRRKLFGDAHADVAVSLMALASVLRERGDRTEAEQLFREALDLFRKRLPADHPYLASSLNNLALVLREGDDVEAAEPLYREALAIAEKKLPSVHPTRAAICDGLGRVLLALAVYPGLPPSEQCAYLAEAETMLLAAATAYGQSPEYSAKAPPLWGILADVHDRWHTAEPSAGHDVQGAEWRAKYSEWQASTQPAGQAPRAGP